MSGSTIQGLTLYRPKIGKRIPTFLTNEDVDRLLNAKDADYDLKLSDRQIIDSKILWLKDVILFGVGTGLRLSEITSLRWRDVDFVSGFLTVRNHETFKTKSGHERSIPLVGDALSTLIKRSESSSTSTDDWVFTNGKGTRLVSGYVSKRFKYYVRLAKLPEEIHFHTLRHTCASWLAQNGVSLLTIQKILGHSDFRDTLIYSHLQPSVMKDAMVTTFGSGN